MRGRITNVHPRSGHVGHCQAPKQRQTARGFDRHDSGHVVSGWARVHKSTRFRCTVLLVTCTVLVECTLVYSCCTYTCKIKTHT